jgi:hypothetical protein
MTSTVSALRKMGLYPEFNEELSPPPYASGMLTKESKNLEKY